MADQQPPQSTLASTFPDPPPFWHDFTPEKLARIEELRKKDGTQKHAEKEPVKRIANIAEDLINLQPPPEPEDGKWRCFGDLYTLKDELPTLEEQGIERLVPTTAEPSSSDSHTDRAFELKRLTKSLLLNFLELNGVLSINPDQAEEKVTDIRTILINIHHTLNEYRPHQARQSLIDMMQTQLDKTRAETAAVRAVTDKAKRVLEGLGSIEIPDDTALKGDAEKLAKAEPSAQEKGDKYWQGEREKWAVIDAEFA